MYYECLEGLRSEDGLSMSDRFISRLDMEEPYPLRRWLPGFDSERSSLSHLLSIWYSIITAYGPRKLTKQQDKLVALGGIAALLAEKLEDRYYAGIWRKSMIEGLLWQGLEITDLEVDRKPSWSWAAINGIPATGLGDTKWEALAEILDCEVELEGLNEFGAVKNGWIKMEAPLVPLVFLESESRTDDTGIDAPLHPKHVSFRTSRGSGESWSHFDFIGEKHNETETLAKKGQTFALILAVDVDGPDNSPSYYRALLVTPVSAGGEHTVRRVGFWIPAARLFAKDEVLTSRATVTLV